MLTYTKGLEPSNTDIVNDHADACLSFGKSLLDWYRPERRPMPWKSERDPYKIWVSEVILQQTRVAQGHKYYLKFIETFPDIATLASSSQEEVLKTWQGLGYYRRAIHLHEGARQVMDQFGGKLPANESDLLKLKGIGPYAAAAIGSFAFALPLAVVDGNVYRILARYFAIATPTDTSAGAKQFKQLAQHLIGHHHPGRYNQAIMDFGALLCTPTNPGCSQCPLQTNCQAYLLQSIDQFPVRNKKPIRKNRYIHYIVLTHGEKTLMRRRADNDIYRRMYEYISLTSDKPIPDRQILQEARNLVPQHHHVGPRSDVFRHTLTHLQLYVTFTEIATHTPPEHLEGHWVTNEELNALPLPAFIADYQFGRNQ